MTSTPGSAIIELLLELREVVVAHVEWSREETLVKIDTRIAALRLTAKPAEDPADVWDAYCAEVPAKRRSPQGALAFGFEAGAQPTEEGWRSMETVPKDGREVLLQVKLRAGIQGKCLVGHYMPGGFCISDHPAIDAGWYFWNGCMFDKAAEPIKWMPVPALSTTTGAPKS